MFTWLHSSDAFPQPIGWILDEGVCKNGESVDWRAGVGTTHLHLPSVLIHGNDVSKISQNKKQMVI